MKEQEPGEQEQHWELEEQQQQEPQLKGQQEGRISAGVPQEGQCGPQPRQPGLHSAIPTAVTGGGEHLVSREQGAGSREKGVVSRE